MRHTFTCSKLQTLSWPALQGGVYSAAPDLDEPAHHGLDEGEAVPGADPGTPGSATVRRDMVIISQSLCHARKTLLTRRRWCCRIANRPAISWAVGLAIHLTSLVNHTHGGAFIYWAWHMQCRSQS